MTDERKEDVVPQMNTHPKAGDILCREEGIQFRICAVGAIFLDVVIENVEGNSVCGRIAWGEQVWRYQFLANMYFSRKQLENVVKIMEMAAGHTSRNIR